VNGNRFLLSAFPFVGHQHCSACVGPFAWQVGGLVRSDTCRIHALSTHCQVYCTNHLYLSPLVGAVIGAPHLGKSRKYRKDRNVPMRDKALFRPILELIHMRAHMFISKNLGTSNSYLYRISGVIQGFAARTLFWPPSVRNIRVL
jgi:hypothetical protein